ALVFPHHVHRGLEQAIGARIPFHVDPLVGLVFPRAHDARAIGLVHHQALALLDRADDGVARDRTAAARELHRHAFGAADGDARAERLLALRVGMLEQAPRHDGGQALAQANVGEQLLLRAPTAVWLPALPAWCIHLG